jgi:hypothetical protein
MREPNPKLALASGEYDLAKSEAVASGRARTVTIALVGKRLRLRPRSLANYRANYYSRRSRSPNESSSLRNQVHVRASSQPNESPLG